MDLKRILPVAALLASVASAAIAADLDVKSENGIRYVSGGVGQAEQEAMKDAARNYSLNLLFVGADGRYLADVSTTITKGRGGEILSTVADGPMLLVDLPPGHYTVEAAAEGRTFTRKVDISRGKPQKIVLRWPVGAESNGSGRNDRP